MQDNEKYLIQKANRSFKINQESKKIGREVRDILRRVSFVVFLESYSCGSILSDQSAMNFL